MQVRHNEKIITRDYKNITLNYKNIKRHLTEVKNTIKPSHKIIISSSIIITLSFLNIIFNTVFLNTISNTSALTYSDNVNMQFTFNPTINVTITGDLSIDELVPGGYSDSNIVNVNVATNNSNGYYLSANVGSSTNNPSTELRLSNYNANDGSNGSTNPIFTSLLTTDSYSSMGNDNISPNTWGYSYSLDGTTWSNYSGLPLYNDPTNPGTKLKENYSPSNDIINFKIAAKASNIQPSGTYTNTINFIATAHPTPLSLEQSYAYYGKEKVVGTNYYSMQDMTTGICQSADINSTMTVMDIRDNNTYTIAKLKDGNCWLLDNLRLDPTDPTVYTNISEDNTNAINAAIANYLGTNHTSNPGWSDISVTTTWSSSFIAPIVVTDYKDDTATNYGIGSGKVGVYYNYCAASVGTYCYADGQGVNLPDTLIDAFYDVCPAGWRLPTGGSEGEFQTLSTAITGVTGYVNGEKAIAIKTILSIPLSGFYNNMQQAINEEGDWWSSTQNNNNQMYRLGISQTGVAPQIEAIDMLACLSAASPNSQNQTTFENIK